MFNNSANEFPNGFVLIVDFTNPFGVVGASVGIKDGNFPPFIVCENKLVGSCFNFACERVFDGNMQSAKIDTLLFGLLINDIVFVPIFDFDMKIMFDF